MVGDKSCQRFAPTLVSSSTISTGWKAVWRKPRQALSGAGDEAPARQFVERAVALPFDEHEQVHPAMMMAHQRLFEAVTDALKSGGGDWLAAAADTFASAPKGARYCLRDVLTSVLQDYDISNGEPRRLRRLISDVPHRAELPDLDLPPEQMVTAFLDVLEGVIHTRTPTRRASRSPTPGSRAKPEPRIHLITGHGRRPLAMVLRWSGGTTGRGVSDVKVMRLRYAGRCACGTELAQGERAAYDRAARRVLCLPCHEGTSAPAAAPPPQEPQEIAVEPRTLDVGVAGGGALREYQRRAAKDEAARAERSRLWRAMNSFFYPDGRQSTTPGRSGQPARSESPKR